MNETCFATTDCPASNNFTTDTTRTVAHTDHKICSRHSHSQSTSKCQCQIWCSFSDMTSRLYRVAHQYNSAPNLKCKFFYAEAGCSRYLQPVNNSGGDHEWKIVITWNLRSLDLSCLAPGTNVHDVNTFPRRKAKLRFVQQCNRGCHGRSRWKDYE